jgi:RNA polymerase sigma factor (sigma-70 family)
MMMQARSLDKSRLAGQPAEAQASRAEARAFLRLYDEFFARVYNYARYRCGDAVIADDLTAQTFERALKYWVDFDPARGAFGAWLFTIARNVINNHLRGEQRRNCLPLDSCSEQPDRSANLEDSLIQMETQSEILSALMHLDERERDLLSLKFAAGLTNRRIAEITGMTENHVGVILYRALHRLRALLERMTNQHALPGSD